jgi:hypothetical protein
MKNAISQTYCCSPKGVGRVCVAQQGVVDCAGRHGHANVGVHCGGCPVYSTFHLHPILIASDGLHGSEGRLSASHLVTIATEADSICPCDRDNALCFMQTTQRVPQEHGARSPIKIILIAQFFAYY